MKTGKVENRQKSALATFPPPKKIAVWFSCGAPSACAAKLAVEQFGAGSVRVLNTPVIEEHPDNKRFCRDVEQWLGVPVETVTHPVYGDSASAVWDKLKFMSSPAGASCTLRVKKKARQWWERRNQVDYHVLGFTLDERDRHERFVLTERENVLPLLIDAGMTREDCFNKIRAAKIELPELYKLNYPNANCVGCCKATSPTYWNLVRRTFPEVFEARARQSRRLGVRLVRYKGKRMFLDELPPHARGQALKAMPDCGLFCEEYGD